MHYIFTDYANFKPNIRKELACCLTLFLEVYDFINQYEREVYDSLEAHILEVESQEDAEKSLCHELRKRGLYLGSSQEFM